MGEDPELIAEFVIAEKLGMTVARLREEMSELEFLQWTRYLSVKASAQELADKQAMGRI